MPIRILPPEVASQIAAGEVVERPASVVKELVENALDAGARRVTVRVEGGGQRMVEVADDGYGIPPDEMPLAVERHATSKLASAEDLFRIHSLGFRGEALASIASVSCLTLTSTVAGEPHGRRIRVEGGRSEPPAPVGAPVGTTVRVEDLFFNLPARRKFLKNENSERRLIESLVARYALAYPHVRFTLEQEGRTSVQTSGSGGRVEVLANLFGTAVARQLMEVQFQGDEISVSGFISLPGLTRSNRREIIFF
ncbi:MAG: DNA mismatch repair endonuclease MutL, partial [Anaerolineales bacterium]|nr:DNA mismatch repair endonuclease MutL [Anaerolineales bacterium]